MWRKKQHMDHFFKKAKINGYRARSAFKLIEIQKKYALINANDNILDLGCAPGSWLQVSKQYTKGWIGGIDLKCIEPISGTYFKQCDFLKSDISEILQMPKIDVLLSDMSPNTSGYTEIDHQSSINLLLAVYSFAIKYDIHKFVSKILDGPSLKNNLQSFINYETKIFKPQSSKTVSKEIYVIAKKI